MSERHRREYSEGSVDAHVVELVTRHRNPNGKVVLDLGCGFGAIAEAISELGLTYVGLDSDAEAVEDLKERGFEAATMDLSDPARIGSLLESVLDGRPLAACTLIDFLARHTRGPAVLDALRAVSVAHGRAPVVVSVPNITHIDIAAKLLIGRFDYTETGLLGRSQVAFYSPARLDEVLSQAGWQESGRHDFEVRRSDQNFPEDAAALAPGTPLHRLLLDIRQHACEGAIVHQFVRAYAPREQIHDPIDAAVDAPFLSVLVRTQGNRRSTLTETLLSLAAQTVDDFEVLLLAHDMPGDGIAELKGLVATFDESFARRVRLIRVEGGGRAHPLNIGVQQAKGTYVAALDDDDLAFAHWVETFRRTGSANVGMVVRTVVAEQQIEPTPWGDVAGYATTSAATLEFPGTFDLWEHVHENQSPFCGLAFPRSCFTVMGIEFDESLPVVEDWDVLLQAALLCGVASVREVTSLYRRWQSPQSSRSTHRVDEWRRAGEAVLARLDRRAIPLPPGTLSDYLRLYDDLREQRDLVEHLVFERNAARGEMDLRGDRIEEMLNELHTTRIERDLAVSLAERQHEEIERVHGSVSWKMTRPVRQLKALTARFRARPPTP